jgi:hypothetical protein
MSIFFLHYNFCRIRATLSKGKKKGMRGTATTPAMKAGLTDHVWSQKELLRELATH